MSPIRDKTFRAALGYAPIVVQVAADAGKLAAGRR